MIMVARHNKQETETMAPIRTFFILFADLSGGKTAQLGEKRSAFPHRPEFPTKAFAGACWKMLPAGWDWSH